jgi:multidrug efflux system membrane fusion protein
MRTFRTPVALVAAFALAMTACSRPEPTVEAVPRVSVVTVGPQVVQRDDELPGRVAAVRTAQIRAQVGGIVQRRMFEQGAEVHAGEPLFQIDPAAFRAVLSKAGYYKNWKETFGADAWSRLEKYTGPLA